MYLLLESEWVRRLSPIPVTRHTVFCLNPHCWVSGAAVGMNVSDTNIPVDHHKNTVISLHGENYE